MSIFFDEVIDRRNSDSIKWRMYDEDVLPMWVADMDFRSPPAAIAALHERVEHGVFGYAEEISELRQVICERMEYQYKWKVTPDEVVFLPGVVTGFNLACQAVAGNGGVVTYQTPVYPPFLKVTANGGLCEQPMELTLTAAGTYEIDYSQFDQSVNGSEVFLLCNPHNPVGRVFTKAELEKMADICLRHNVYIVSDEIHCDFTFGGNDHIPIASLSPEVSQHTITLMAPSKTFNIAGLECSYAIIQNKELKKKFNLSRHGMVSGTNLLGAAAALACYKNGQDWLDQLLRYLKKNRDYLVDFIHKNIPELRVASPEGTYLAWIDCRSAGLSGTPYEFFLRRARVAVSDGSLFGKGGEGFIRFNFGTTRALVQQSLSQMKAALQQAGG